MNTNRLQSILRQAKALQARHDVLNRQWAARIAIQDEPIAQDIHTKAKVRPSWVTEALGRMGPRGKVVGAPKPINQSQLVAITPYEHKWLLDHGYPQATRWTRMVNVTANEWIDCAPFVESKFAVVKEFRIGDLSINCLASDSDSESDGLAKSQMAQETEAEITDMLTMLYEDAPAFDEWMKQEITRRLKGVNLDARVPSYRAKTRRVILQELPTNIDGKPLKTMIEDEDTGEYRPIRYGDYFQIAWGSNEDLDALFMEEGDDPRRQEDVTNEGTDHRWSGRFRSNTQLEEKFLTNSCYSNPAHARKRNEWTLGKGTNRKNDRYIVPNTAVPDLRWSPGPQTLRRLADQIVERNGAQDTQVLPTIDAVEHRLRNIADDLQYSDGALAQGHFITKDEYFATLDHNHHLYERCVLTPQGTRIPGARPQPIDWQACREAQAKVDAQPYERSHPRFKRMITIINEETGATVFQASSEAEACDYVAKHRDQNLTALNF
jgi:hypothetical protein